jgi:hypothetical protein
MTDYDVLERKATVSRIRHRMKARTAIAVWAVVNYFTAELTLIHCSISIQVEDSCAICTAAKKRGRIKFRL